MAANGTLYTYPENFRAFKALIAAQYSGAKVNVDNNFVFGETNKSDSFLKKFPLGKVPAFETTDGKCIFESNAIAWAVANDQLRGKATMDQAQVIAWMNFADNEILPASCTWVFPCLGIMQFNKSNTERAKEDVKKALGALNTHLLPRTFLVGERISLADISVCCTLLHLYQYVLEPSFRKPFQNVNRWFSTIINQPQVKAVIGEFKLCEKMAQFDNKKFAEVQGKIKQGGGEKKEKKEKKETKKEQPKKEKEASPAAAPAEPKPKDPLDALPAGLDGCVAQPTEQDCNQESSESSSVSTLIPLVERESPDGGSCPCNFDTKTPPPGVENIVCRGSSSSDVVENVTPTSSDIFVESVSPRKSPSSDTSVPPPVEKVQLKHIESMPKLVVYFDLETTGLEADCHIVQLSSAVGQQYFNTYILPSKNISWKASEVTGLTFNSGSLYLKGKMVEALEPREALQKWLNWIRPIAPVVLIAHNCFNFDARRLLNNYEKYGLLDELGRLVMGFVDTLPMFKELYPKMSSYREEELVTKILKESYEAHDSLADVQSLQKLVMKHNLNDKLLLKFSFTYQSLLEYIEYSKKGKENAASLQSLVDSKHLSRGMAETVGKSGLTLENLKKACVEGGKELLEKVLSEPTSSGQPRVTRNRSVLNKLHDFFSSDGSSQ